MAEQSAWDFINNLDDENKLEIVVINPCPIHRPTLSGNLSSESMNMFKKLIQGKMPMIPQAAINISDGQDVAKIHGLALENKEAIGKRFVVTTENANTFVTMAEILKSNGYDKVSSRLLPNFLVKFNSDLKGMLPFIGYTYNANVSDTMKTFKWSPIALGKTILDTATSVSKALSKHAC